MKKLYTVVMLFSSLLFCKAQTPHIATTSLKAHSFASKNGNPAVMTVDTMLPSVVTMPCFTGDPSPLVYYTLGSAGFLAGTSSYGTTECAQRYAFTGVGSINTVLVEYGKKAGSAGTTSAKIYTVDAVTKLPSAALGTSAVVTIANIPASGYTAYNFSTAVNVTTDFVVSAVLPTTSTSGDSVVIVSTKESCCAPDSEAYLNIPGFGGWNFMNELLNAKTPNDTSIDLIILPIVNVAGGVSEPSSNGLTLKGAYPSPATDLTTLRYSLVDNSVVAVKVFDLAGNTIMESSNRMLAGEHEIKVNVKDLAAGNYYYTIRTERGQLTSKFSVVR